MIVFPCLCYHAAVPHGKHPILSHAALFLCAFFLLGASAPSELETCRSDLKAAHGFDVIRVWIEGGTVSKNNVYRILGTHYEQEALSIARVLSWMEEHENETRAIFRTLKQALEGPEEFKEIKKERFRSTLSELKKEMTSAPDYLWDYVSEWQSQSQYPHGGLPPTRNQFIQRTRLVALEASRHERLEFISMLMESKYLNLNILASRGRGALTVEEALLRWDRKKHVVERFLQGFVLEADRQLSALPLGSYPPSRSWRMRRLQDFSRLFADSERGTYLDATFFSDFYMPIFNRMTRNRRWHGLDFNSFPLGKRLIVRAFTQALVGEMRQLPKVPTLVEEFTLFLRQQVGILADQAKIEGTVEFDSEELEQKEAETTSTEEAATEQTLPSWMEQEAASLLTTAYGPAETAVPLTLFSFTDPSLSVTAADIVLDVALTKAEEQTGTLSETKVRRRRVKPPKPTPAELTEVEEERSLPRLEVPRDEVLRLMESFTPTDWHARLIRKQMAGLQRLSSEALYDRILQSIHMVLTSIDLSQRAQDSYHGRHLKKLSQKGLWQIKPQGRTPVRVILGLGEGGYHLLRILPRAKNNANATNRQLNDIAEEYAALK